MLRRILTVLKMIKFQHPVFSLPFAAVGAAYAARGWPPLGTCLWILGAMVGARTAAMSFNRMADTRFDAAADGTLPLPAELATPGG